MRIRPKRWNMKNEESHIHDPWYIPIYYIYIHIYIRGFQIFSPEILGGHGGEAGYEQEGENVLVIPDPGLFVCVYNI